jgi:large subunit ribosomal protein L19
MVKIKKPKVNYKNLMTHIESMYLKKRTKVSVGDKIKLGIEIYEGGKIRIQIYEGIIISNKNLGVNQTITIRKIFHGVGLERCFLPHSPKVKFINIVKSAKSHRSKLYYLRKLSSKAKRLRKNSD